MDTSKKSVINVTKLRQAIRRSVQRSGKRFSVRHPYAVSFFGKVGITPGKLREHATKLLASGALAGSLLLTSASLSPVPQTQSAQLALLSREERQKLFSQELKALVPSGASEFSLEQEKSVRTLIHDYWGIDATVTLEGKRLNRHIGIMGAEQHLPRFPGDTIDQHGAVRESGITPGLGAWGYFASSKSELTADLIEKEKYYVAVQTLYIPGWNENWAELKEWYRYRTVVVVNPENGKLIISDIADAGPAEWTGKQFGGAPEVMGYLELRTGKQKGRVLVFFVDDPEHQIRLGPVNYTDRL